ncbi:transcriptional regulator family: Fungal Specific TF [Penicillium chrysogenum]|nr:transcriptional regulator family: Fungal Specific TF [Penicillium chrysogenum]
MMSSQSNNSAASPSMEPPSKKRPADDDTVTPPPKRAPSGTQPSNSNNIVAPSRERSASGSQPLSSEIPKRLWTIFVEKHAPVLPILDLDQLTAAFALAASHGKVGPTVIDPTFGLCIAIACHLTPDEDLWGGGNWYKAALSNMADPFKSRPSIQSFHHGILQVQYLHMVGHLREAWDVLSLAIGRAHSLRMPTMHGGSLAVDENSLEQVRLVWQCLWMKKLSLTLQYGVVHQSLDTFYELPMPMQHHIHGNMGVSGAESNGHCHAISSFFVACASLFKYTDDLITVENDLRVIRMECPIKWLSSVDLHGFQQLNEKLSSWKIGLPKCLEWKGPGSDFTMKHPLIRRMCILAHLRYVYFRLRQYRPFFILTLRLSQACACEVSPHITGNDVDLIDASPFLGLVYYSAVKCLTAAQDMVNTLSASIGEAPDEHAKCEHLEYLYAAGLILIAARTVPFVLNGAQRGNFDAINAAQSVKTMTEQLNNIDHLLQHHKQSSQQAPELERTIERLHGVLRQLRLQSDGIATDNNIMLEQVVWCRIYDRLGLEVPFKRPPNKV